LIAPSVFSKVYLHIKNLFHIFKNISKSVAHQYVVDHISGGGHLQYMFSHHAEFDNKNYTVLH